MAKKDLVIILTKSAKSQDFTQGIFKERYHYIHVLYLYDNYRYIVSFLPLHIYFHRSFGSGPQFFISAKTSLEDTFHLFLHQLVPESITADKEYVPCLILPGTVFRDHIPASMH